MIRPVENSGISPIVQPPTSGVRPEIAMRIGEGFDLAVDDFQSAPGAGVAVQGVFGALSNNKDAANRVAGDIRGLGEARSLINRVREGLELIVKSFPPFPPGSLERERFLSSVAGIRVMIERLTFPPEQKRAIDDTLSDKVFTSSSASSQSMTEGMAALETLDIFLADAQAGLSGEVRFDTGIQGDDAFYLEQSHGIGMALQQQNKGIVRAAGQLLGLIG